MFDFPTYCIDAASNEEFRQPLESSPATKIAVLIENHKDQNRTELVAEHGLSLHIERNGKAFLFDTGSSGAVVQNARRMDADLRDVDAVVISHGPSIITSYSKRKGQRKKQTNPF